MNEYRPYTIQFEGLSICNARCKFCPVSTDMTRKIGEMSDKLFHKIIKEGKKLGIKRFVPFLNGEPFLHYKIFEWLDYMEKEKVIFLLYTNGSLLTKEKIDRLVKYKYLTFINISLNAATAETHKKVMCLNNFDEIVENIKYLKEKAPFQIKVSFNKVKDNEHEMKQFTTMWKGMNHVNRFVNWAGYKHDDLEMTGTAIPCHHLANMYVLWDGRVCLCCFDFDGKVILGDLNKQSIKEVWDNSKYIRDSHANLNFDLDLCRDCNVNRKDERKVKQ